MDQLELICPPNGGKKTENLPSHHLMSAPSPCLSLLQEEQYFPLRKIHKVKKKYKDEVKK